MFEYPLNTTEVEALFTRITTALLADVFLDGIDQLPDGRGCRIRSHDRFGRLPEIRIECRGERDRILDRLSLEIARLGAVTRLRCELAAKAHSCEFTIPTPLDRVIRVGIRLGDRTVLARGKDPCQAYQKLGRKLSDTWVDVPQPARKDGHGLNSRSIASS